MLSREVFEATLEEVVARTGWQVYSHALMENHYHLVIKTPKANLVDGMTWFQNTVTKRHNARNRLRGHLFYGRYRAVIVEEIALHRKLSLRSSRDPLSPINPSPNTQ